MKVLKIIICACCALSAALVSAQTTIRLNINHLFNEEVIQQGGVYSTGPGGVDLRVDRLQYYLSEFTIVHDGGQETHIDEMWLLVDAFHGNNHFLGVLDVEDVEQIIFSVGVELEYNHEDPSLYQQAHPLAHQNPSMHWGWTSGYRFLCVEGEAGASLSDMMQLHSLGDANYFQQTQEANCSFENGEIIVHLDARYDQIFNEISIAGGLFEHSETSAPAVGSLENMRDLVFSPAIVGVSDPALSEINVYPNPTTDELMVIGVENGSLVEIFDLNGRAVRKEIYSGSAITLSDLKPGVYHLVINGEVSEKLLVE